jgi:hypothetical protein
MSQRGLGGGGSWYQPPGRARAAQPKRQGPARGHSKVVVVVVLVAAAVVDADRWRVRQHKIVDWEGAWGILWRV